MRTVKRIVLAFGTRPEATKMAPVYSAIAAHPGLTPLILSTGQQREQLDTALAVFGLTPDRDMQVMTERQTLAGLTAKIVPLAGATLREMGADMVLVHGDTSTSFCVALSAFYEGIPVGHVEAGLRSGSLSEPFPEEANRRLTAVLSTLDFAPTPLSKANILREGKPEAGVVVTGQTAVDAVREVAGRTPLRSEWQARLDAGQGLVTVTMHRRENLPFMPDMARALREVAQAHPELHFIYPVHLNPAVQEAAAIGVPHPHRGETVKVFVVFRPGMQASQNELESWCRERLSPYKVPKLYEVRSELPKSAVGKVLRRALADQERAAPKAAG